MLAGSEVGKAGLGATWNGGSCRAGLLAASVTFLGLGDRSDSEAELTLFGF